MSTQSPWSGYMIPVVLAFLGIFGIIVNGFFLLAFFVVLAYYLYRVEKRVSALEGNSAGSQSKPK